MAEESAIVKTVYDGKVLVTNGTTISYELPCSVGMDISGLRESQREVLRFETRGVLRSIRKGKRVYASGSVEIYATGLSHATKTSAFAILLKQAPNSADVSTGTSYGDVFTQTVKLNIEGLSLGDDADHSITLPYCDFEIGFKEGEPDTLTGAFTCSGIPTFA